MRKRKAFLSLSVAFFILLIAGNAAAQSDAIGDNPIDTFFDNVADQIDWYEGEDFSDFLIFILIPAVGMYAIFRYIFTQAFHFADENFRQSSGIGSDSISNIGDSMAKLLAGATSIMALVYWGGTLGLAMIVAGAAGSIWYVWALASGLVGTTSPLPFRGGDGDGDGGDANQAAQEAQQAAQEAQEAAEEIRDALNRGDGDEAIEDIERALILIEEADTDIEQVLATDIEQLGNAIAEIRDELNLEEGEVEREREIEQILEDMNNKVNMALNVDGSEEGPPQRAYRSRLGYIEGETSLQDDAEALVNILQDIDVGEERAVEEIQDEVARLEEAAKQIAQSVSIVQVIENVLEESEEDWEYLVERAGEREELAVEEEQLEQLEEEKDRIRSLEREAVEHLEEARELLSQQAQVTQEEINILGQELNEEDQLGHNVIRLHTKMSEDLGDHPLVDSLRQVANRIQGDISPAVERIESMDEQEFELESKVAGEIDEILDQFEN